MSIPFCWELSSGGLMYHSEFGTPILIQQNWLRFHHLEVCALSICFCWELSSGGLMYPEGELNIESDLLHTTETEQKLRARYQIASHFLAFS